MLQKILCTATGMTMSLFLMAQMSSVDEGKAIYEKMSVPSYTVLIEPETDWVRDAFKDYMKERHDISMKGQGLFSNKDVMRAEEVLIPTLSQSPVNFYARIVAENTETRIDLFAQQGGTYFSEGNGGSYQQLRSMLEGFLDAKLLSYYQLKLEDLTEKQEDIRDDIQSLERDIQKNRKDIAKMEREILEKKSENQRMTLEISELQDALARSKTTLDEWQEKVDEVREALIDM